MGGVPKNFAKALVEQSSSKSPESPGVKIVENVPNKYMDQIIANKANLAILSATQHFWEGRRVSGGSTNCWAAVSKISQSPWYGECWCERWDAQQGFREIFATSISHTPSSLPPPLVKRNFGLPFFLRTFYFSPARPPSMYLGVE